MSKIRYVLAAMVGALLTASCGVPFRVVDQPKSQPGKGAVASEAVASPIRTGARKPY
jgi:hypothetical protein